MRVTMNVDKLTIANGPGASKLLDAALALLDGAREVNLDFTVENDLTGDRERKRLRATTLSRRASGSSLFPIYLSGMMENDAVEVLYTHDRREPIRGEITEL